MTPSLKSVLPALVGVAAGGLYHSLSSGRSLAYAVLWAIGAAAVAAFVLWLTTLSNDKPKSEDPPPG